MSFAALIDERHQPPLRETCGLLLASARTADIAITHLRLAGLDLRASEAGGLERCRLMVGRFDAAMLHDTATATAAREQLQLLIAFGESGRLEVRTAPHHVWNPDFSIFRGLPRNGSVSLLGAHYFGRPYPMYGLAFTCVIARPRAVQACAARFDELWAAGYDILPVILDSLHELLR